MLNNIRKKIYFPITLSVELVKGCVNKCFFCNSDRNIFLMPASIINSVIKGFSEIKVDNVTPFGMGESLIHPLFYDFFEELIEVNKDKCAFNDLVLNTSGISFNSRRMIDIIEKHPHNGFHRIHFSLDADSQVTWEKIGKSKNLTSIKEKISSFTTWKVNNRHIEPLITVSMVDHNQLTTDEKENFIETWSTFFNSLHINFENCSTWPPHHKNAIYIRSDTRFEKTEKREKCTDNNFIIKADGKVFACVRNDIPDKEFIIGDLNKQSLLSILSSSKSEDFINKKYVPDFCRKCSNEC